MLLYQDEERLEAEAEQREVCGITGDPTENAILISVDSGSDAHCCPLDYFSHLGEKVGEGHVLRDAQGKEIPHKVDRSIRHLLQGEGGEQIASKAELIASHVSEVIMPAGKAVQAGGVVHFEAGGSYMTTPKGEKVSIVMNGKSFYIEPKLAPQQGTKVPASRVAPIGEEEGSPTASSSGIERRVEKSACDGETARCSHRSD